MKKERRWFQIGAGLGLFLSFVVFAGCAKVYVNCAPSEAMRDKNAPPTGGWCTEDKDGHCVKRGLCTCP